MRSIHTPFPVRKVCYWHLMSNMHLWMMLSHVCVMCEWTAFWYQRFRGFSFKEMFLVLLSVGYEMSWLLLKLCVWQGHQLGKWVDWRGFYSNQGYHDHETSVSVEQKAKSFTLINNSFLYWSGEMVLYTLCIHWTTKSTSQ